MKTKLSYAIAEHIAASLVSRFAPNCLRIEVAGSVRRQKAEIGDIEIVAIPTPALYEQLDSLLDAGKIRHREPRKCWGEKLRSFLFDTAKGYTLQVDMFLQPDPATWGINFMIRTGSKEFAHKMVTKLSQGGWLPDCYHVEDARVWCDGRAIPTDEEKDVFSLWDMDYVPPPLRTADYVPPKKLEQVESDLRKSLVIDGQPSRFTFADAERLTRESALWPLPTFPGGPGAAARAAIEASEAARKRAQGVKE